MKRTTKKAHPTFMRTSKSTASWVTKLRHMRLQIKPAKTCSTISISSCTAASISSTTSSASQTTWRLLRASLRIKMKMMRTRLMSTRMRSKPGSMLGIEEGSEVTSTIATQFSKTMMKTATSMIVVTVMMSMRTMRSTTLKKNINSR